MYFVYSIILSLGFLLMLPLFILRREKYASGFKQRLGNYPAFYRDGRPVIWLHCVSVGETNAARPLVDAIKDGLPGHRLILSTTTKTGNELARKIFAEKADAVFYFPFDWKFSVRKALRNYGPSLVLLMETEIWPRFIREAKLSGAKVAIVNGRLSERSARRYRWIRPFIMSVFSNIDLALMQGSNDAGRIVALGMERDRVRTTGNLKFDLELNPDDQTAARSIEGRFMPNDSRNDRPLIIAASTHEPEERLVLEAYCSVAAGATNGKPRLMIAPRHPERFDAVARQIRDFRDDPACEWPRYKFARRSAEPSPEDAEADIILLDSIGELRGVYPLAEVVFVGGSLIPHGGQSVLEPAAAGKAIITGSFTDNFADVVQTFRGSKALIQLPVKTREQLIDELFISISDLLENVEARRALGLNAAAVMNASKGATRSTIEAVAELAARIER